MPCLLHPYPALQKSSGNGKDLSTDTCIYNKGRQGPYPGAYVYIHRLSHRLGYRIDNHRQLPFGAIQWVTYMPCMTLGESLTGIGNAQQDGYTCSARQPV